VKLLKGPIYEMRFSDCADSFAEHQKQLELSIALFTAETISSVRNSLSEIQETLRNDTQTKITVNIFQHLRNPAEKEFMAFVESKGGIEACIKDDKVLAELINMRYR
jgi:prefoldin subunit 5